MMNCKVSYNYTASAACTKGQLLTFDADSSTTAKICAKPAIAGDIIIGVALHDCNQGDGVTLGSLIDGQTFKILVAGSVSAGDFLEIDSDGDVQAANNTGSPLPLCAMFAGSNGLIDCVVADNPSADVNIQGNINIDGDSEINFGTETLTAPVNSGPIGIDTSGVSVVDGKTNYAVGAISFLVCQRAATWYSGTLIQGANLAVFRPMYLKVASDGTFIVQPRADGNFVIEGVWRVLVGSTNDVEGDYNIILAQRIM